MHYLSIQNQSADEVHRFADKFGGKVLSTLDQRNADGQAFAIAWLFIDAKRAGFLEQQAIEEFGEGFLEHLDDVESQVQERDFNDVYCVLAREFMALVQGAE